MKNFYGLLLFFVFSVTLVNAQTANHVVVSEVFYLGSSGATEFVELYNPTANDVDLTGYELRTDATTGTNGGSWSLALTGKTIKAGGFLLVGGSSVSPSPDVSFPATKGLNNSAGRAGVRLYVATTNATVDIVSWDATSSVGVEGTPFLGAGVTSSNPKSIERKAVASSTTASMIAADANIGNGWDSNNNSVDFVLRDVPQPQNSLNAIESPFSGPDTTGPTILSIKPISNTQIELQFDEAVDSITSSTAANYSINKSITVSSALRQSGVISKVDLTVSAMVGDAYTLTASSIKDTSGNVMQAPNIVNFSYGTIPIAQARTLGAGTSVRVKGIVTVGNEFASPAFIQDSTGGLAVFNSTFSQRAKLGDIWEVAGTLKNFNGLLEIDPLSDSLKISSGNFPPLPKIIASNGLNESLEGQLVRINKIKFVLPGNFGPNTADSSYTANDGIGAVEVRIDRQTNIPGSLIPSDSVNVVGIVNEFNGSYRIVPRSIGDIGVVDPPPNQTWTDIVTARNLGTGIPTRIRGVVTYNQPGSIIYIQDRTGGVALFDAKTDTLIEGDSVEAYGAFVQFNNLLEMQPVDSLTLLSRGLSIIVPKNIPLQNISESYESQLIRVNSVRFTASGTFTGNTNYNVTDGSGSLQVRIITGSPLVGQTIPVGAVNLIGILGQFQTTYQLIPRFAEDIIPLPGPQIFSTPQIISLTDNGFTVSWTTVIDGNSVVYFGTSPSLTDSIVSATLTSNHSVAISGLTGGRIYYLRVSSTDGSGTSSSSIFSVVTTSSASTGQIHVYFNYSIDNTLGLLPSANGNTDLSVKLLERISAATKSIDLALYSFDDFNASAADIAQRVADSLIAAKNRGVKVRVVFENRTTTAPINSLMSAGISVIKRPSVLSGLMHNKFWVFDGRDTTSATDDWVIGGSWNVTDAGTFRDAQNAVFIQDQSLTRIYTLEFEEMFGSSTETANSNAAKFGPQKQDNTPHYTIVGGKKIEVFFSPSDKTTQQIVKSISSANNNVFFGLFSFTRDEIGVELIARKNAGIIVRGMIDNTGDVGVELPALQVAGIDARSAGHSVVTGDFHHKYGIVDPFNDGSDPMVITGSHNWSSSAENDNDENTLIIHDGAIARQFVQEFSNRYKESGGTGSILSVSERKSATPLSYDLQQNFPNPFNPSTKISFSIKHSGLSTIKVYDLLGREITTLMNENLSAGNYTIEWKGTHLPSGVYFYQLRSGSFVSTKKMILQK